MAVEQPGHVHPSYIYKVMMKRRTLPNQKFIQNERLNDHLGGKHAEIMNTTGSWITRKHRADITTKLILLVDRAHSRMNVELTS